MLVKIITYQLVLLITLTFNMAFASEQVRSSTKGFGFEEVVRQAADLAGKNFEDTADQVPEFLLKINYDQWRDIRYKPEKALWKEGDSLFRVEFFHPGFIYNRAVRINIIDGPRSTPVLFNRDLFHYGMNDFADKVPEALGFAGFRLRFPINSRAVYDEFMVFLGASYFRVIGKGQRYGLSARGLAIDTALDSGEIFPWFKEFWLQKPSHGAKNITLYALLDSPSMTGAYRFIVRPGRKTVTEVYSRLFKRKDVKKPAIAPLTSMFLFGENTGPRTIDDFRPEVHDSDGLLIATGPGEWIWRPLSNPRHLEVSSFELKDPLGFGLLQRDLKFDHYQDLEARYDLRPSAWISPKGKWGKGSVELVQIPAEQEYNDNIVCFWVPSEDIQKQKEMTFSYDITWQLSSDHQEPVGQVIATRTSLLSDSGTRRFVIDFSGKRLNSLPADTTLNAVISVKGAEMVKQQIIKNEVAGGWRLVFDIQPERAALLQKLLPDSRKDEEYLDLQAYLRKDDGVLTETWRYLIKAQ